MSAIPPGIARNLPHGWRWATMGDIAEVVGGGTPRTTEPANFGEGEIPWVTPADLSGYTEKYISHGSRFITRRGLDSSAARLLPTGTVLFSSRAPIGYVAIARNPIATNQGFKSFVLKDGVLPEYVYWWLKGSKQLAERLASGTTFLEISGANAKKIPIPVAPLEQQHGIVAEIEKQLSCLDEAVANFKRVRAHIRQYKAAVIEEAASGTTARDLPVIELLSDVFKTGISIKKSESGGVPSLKLSALRDGRIDFTQSKLLPVRVDEVRQILLRSGDFLVTRGNGSIKLVGAGALVEIVPGPVIYPDLLIRVRMRADTIEPRWLNLVWRTKYVRMQIERKAKTTAGIYKISQRDLGSIKLPVPSLEEQKRITAEVERRLSVVEDLETQISQESMRAARLRESVLAHAFSSTRSSSLGGQSEELRS